MKIIVLTDDTGEQNGKNMHIRRTFSLNFFDKALEWVIRQHNFSINLVLQCYYVFICGINCYTIEIIML